MVEKVPATLQKCICFNKFSRHMQQAAEFGCMRLWCRDHEKPLMAHDPGSDIAWLRVSGC